jgi:hypothetical protein
MKRLLLVSFGLILAAGYTGCLPADTTTTGTGGHPGTAGTGNPQGTAGTQGNAGDNGTTGTAGTSGSAGDNGTTGTAGSDATGTAGNSATGTAGSNGGSGNPGAAGSNGGSGNPGVAGSNGGRGGAAGSGQGTAGRGGTGGGTAGNGSAGSGPAGRGGTTGTAGSAAGTTGTAGRGGTTGTAGTTGTGGTSPDDVGKPLDGAMLLGPCLRDTQAAVCATVSGSCPGANSADPALSGVLTTNKTITLGGDPNTSYTVVLHVQGEVESKNYNGGTDMNSTGSSPTLNGWRYPMGTTNPTPSNTNAYNVYMLRVVNPGQTAHQDYMLNSLDGPGTENHTTYGMDYTTPSAGQAGALVVKGTAKITLVAADSNCSMIKNCGPTQNDGNTCAAPIILQNIEPTAKSLNASFDFTKAYNGQWIVLTVKSVTPM